MSHPGVGHWRGSMGHHDADQSAGHIYLLSRRGAAHAKARPRHHGQCRVIICAHGGRRPGPLYGHQMRCRRLYYLVSPLP
jgi:hypothetical protein